MINKGDARLKRWIKSVDVADELWRPDRELKLREKIISALGATTMQSAVDAPVSEKKTRQPRGRSWPGSAARLNSRQGL